MISPRTIREEQVLERLHEKLYFPTGVKTATGEYWKHRKHRSFLLVPASVQGIYPDWMLEDLIAIIGKIEAGAPIKKSPDGRPRNYPPARPIK